MRKLLLPFVVLAVAMCSCGKTPQPKKVSIIPEPVNLTTMENGSYILKNGATVGVAHDSLMPVANYYVGQLGKMNGLKLKAVSGTGDINLEVGYVHEKPEAYTLTADKNGVTVNGASPAGLIMAAATLQQLIPANSENGAAVPFVVVEDYPRFDYRGVHLDVSRHFYTAEQVKDLLDLMARYKLNKFHWHLTDDQGWRIEVKAYPLLVDSGAYRRFNNQDRECMYYQASKDDPMFEIPAELLKINGTDTLYGGYYTQDQIREVVAYASERNIDILPELDMPGHLMGAILGYPYISCKGKAQWGAAFSDPLCVGSDSAMMLAKNIYTEVAGLFPYEYLHLGADEVEKTNWKACPKCQARMKANGLKTEEELQAWFVKDMEKHFNSLGKKLMGWDEILEGGLSPTATIMWWRDWAPDAVPHATAQGNKAILSPCFSMYFDLLEGPEGLKGTYNFDPILPSLNPEQAENVLGVQGNLWCERVPSVARMQYMYFPRILALAETAWSPKESKNWDNFFGKFVEETNFLDAHNVMYRIPNFKGFSDVNVFTDSMIVTVESALPNVQVRYTTDGSNPNSNSTLYTEPFAITESTDFIFRGFRPDGSADEMYKVAYRKEGFSPAVDVTPTKKGILVKHYDYKGRYNQEQCDQIDVKGKLVREYVLDTVNLTKEVQGFMGLVAVGYIDVPKDGVYSFSLKSNDGSTLSIDGSLLINNDNTHGDKEMTAQKALAKGMHKVEIRFFDLNNGGCLRLMMDGKLLDGFSH